MPDSCCPCHTHFRSQFARCSTGSAGWDAAVAATPCDNKLPTVSCRYAAVALIFLS